MLPLRLFQRQFAHPGAAELHLRLLELHPRLGRNRVGDPAGAADDRSPADHRVPAQNRRPGINHDLILNGRMAFGVAHEPALGILGKTEGAQRHPLVKLDPVADQRCLADDDPRGVIDEE